MLKVVTETNRKVIDIEYLAKNFQNYFIFYRSSNEDYPVFLTYRKNTFGFSPALPITNHFCYSSSIGPKEAIEKASKHREIYAVHKSKWGDLFNLENC